MPDWLASWTDTGTSVAWLNDHGSTFTAGHFAHDFAAGTVQLGANWPAGGAAQQAMYSVIVVPQSGGTGGSSPTRTIAVEVLIGGVAVDALITLTPGGATSSGTGHSFAGLDPTGQYTLDLAGLVTAWRSMEATGGPPPPNRYPPVWWTAATIRSVAVLGPPARRARTATFIKGLPGSIPSPMVAIKGGNVEIRGLVRDLNELGEPEVLQRLRSPQEPPTSVALRYRSR